MSQRRVAEFTPKDAIFLSRAIRHSEGIGKIDFEKLAVDMGLKNAATASARFGQIRRKLNEMPFTPATMTAALNSPSPAAPSSGASATKPNKRKAPGPPGPAAKRAKKSTAGAKPAKAGTDIKVEVEEEDAPKTKVECGMSGEIAGDVDSAEENIEQGVKDTTGDETEEDDRPLMIDNHPLHLLKKEMENEDVAAAAQDYEY
ncbi:hypothetical protein MMC27_001451 [Xylographa pallens]|nr:hypothetical protein [Xylographa pallens]